MGSLPAFLCVSLALGVAAPSGPPSQEAREWAEKARRFYEGGEFEQAVSAYSEAHRLHPSPLILFNIAQALRMMGEYQQSLRLYEDYLQAVPNAPNREETQRQIRQLRFLAAAQTPAPLEEQAPPPESTPIAEAPRLPAPPELPASALFSREAQLDPEPLSSPATWTWIVAGVGSALALASGLTYVSARHDASRLGGLSLDAATARKEAAEAKQIAALALGAGALGAGLGVVIVASF